MLKVSQKTEYAMRAMIELALRRVRDGDVLVPARAIAESQQIPLRFLEQQLGAVHRPPDVRPERAAAPPGLNARQPVAGQSGPRRASRDPSVICCPGSG